MMNKILLLLAVFPLLSHAEMNELNEAELESTSGQAGITLSAKADFETGTRISYTNSDAEYKDNQDYWLVVNDITGSVEFKGLKIDLVNDFGPTGNGGAIQITMPDEILFDEFKTEGIYMSSSKEVNAQSRFLMAVEVDGSLQFPAETKMSIFSIQ